MKKILMVLTNQGTYGEHEEATGLWLKEATEFVQAVSQKGFVVDYVSPQGGYVPIDPRSLKKVYTSKADLALYLSEDFKRRALAQSLSPKEVEAADYLAIYYAGGHGVVWDFPDNQELQALSLAIYRNGGYVTSVCHGLAGLLNIKDEQGNYLISGKTITGFTQVEEVLSGKNGLVPFSTEKEARKRGAHFVKKRFFSSYAVQDGQFITGQNPMSGGRVAQLLLAALGC